MTEELRNSVVEVYMTAEALGIRAVLVGALIMEFTTEIKEGYPAYRKTNDADFAVCVKDWTAFDQLRAKLKEKGYTQHPKIEHRLSKGSVIVDLIPYGDAVAKEGAVSWPESEFTMTVIGFDEVCAAAAPAVRSGMPASPGIGAPGFVLLKIIAFQDRSARSDPKHRNDAEHIDYWLENYASISAADSRRFDFAEKMRWNDLEATVAGAALLGHEIGTLASPAAAERILRFLKDSINANSSFVDALLRGGRGFLAEEDLKGRVEDTLSRLSAFQRGFRAARAGKA
ncbi:MAG: hypothetical protein ACYCPQ_11005 [Elusimicrobiota bacterium]